MKTSRCRKKDLEIRHAHIEVRTVRVSRLEEGELGAALLALHTLLEALPMLRHELSFSEMTSSLLRVSVVMKSKMIYPYFDATSQQCETKHAHMDYFP